MNLSKEKFLIKRHSERSLAVAKSKNLGRCIIVSLVRGVAFSCLLFLAACSDDDKTAGGTEEDAGIVAIEDKTVSGVSQKGPFVNGSSVKLYEMDGETLAPTGKSFPGKIASDDGKFTVPSVSLVSQYALLEANGYFRNEITGGKSNGTITLNALTDLSDREKVNINLLTHLEYERALYLVGTGVKVSDAKRQAESEILKAFGIEGNFENSEDMDIFSSGDGNAALLAFSVLMLENLSEADLTERLTNFATDIEQDGTWDDETAKTVIADWASDASLGRKLAEIRNNITGWKLSNEVPAFEKFVNNFWWQNYGLGTCNKERQGEVKANNNVLSAKNGVYFICDNNAWRVAMDVDKDTTMWGTGKFDGEIRAGQDNKDIYYIYEKEKKSWREATIIERDTYQAICSKDGRIIDGKENASAKYVCDDEKFRYADSVEIYGEWGCTSYNRNAYRILAKALFQDVERVPSSSEIVKAKTAKMGRNYSYYKCTEDGWLFTTEKLNKGTMIDERDGQEYKIIGVKSQMWMAENLNYALPEKPGYSNVFFLEDVSKVEQCANDCRNYCNRDNDGCVSDYGDLNGCLVANCHAFKGDSLSYCYNNDVENCSKYGRIYSPAADADEICPNGWHIPDMEEFLKLFFVVDGTFYSSCDVDCDCSGSISLFDDSFGLSVVPSWDYVSLPSSGYIISDGFAHFFRTWQIKKASYRYKGWIAGIREKFKWWTVGISEKSFSFLNSEWAYVRCIKDEE